MSIETIAQFVVKIPSSSDQARHAWVNIMDTASIRICLQKNFRALFHVTIQHCNPSVPSHRFHCDGGTHALTTRAHSDSRHVRSRPCEYPPKVMISQYDGPRRCKRPSGVRRSARLSARGGAGATNTARRLSWVDWLHR